MFVCGNFPRKPIKLKNQQASKTIILLFKLSSAHPSPEPQTKKLLNHKLILEFDTRAIYEKSELQ